MSRLLKWAFNFAAMASAALFLATCVMWVRSYRQCDSLCYRVKTPRTLAVRSEHGRFIGEFITESPSDRYAYGLWAYSEPWKAEGIHFSVEDWPWEQTDVRQQSREQAKIDDRGCQTYVLRFIGPVSGGVALDTAGRQARSVRRHDDLPRPPDRAVHRHPSRRRVGQHRPAPLRHRPRRRGAGPVAASAGSVYGLPQRVQGVIRPPYCARYSAVNRCIILQCGQG